MKRILLVIFVMTIAVSAPLTANAQTTLLRQSGVSLSYSYVYVNTIKCGNSNYDQYKVTAFLENNSGYNIDFLSNSDVSHIMFVNSFDVYPCKQGFANVYFQKLDWPSNSKVQDSYYVLVPNGRKLPEPNWKLGQFTFRNNNPTPPNNRQPPTVNSPYANSGGNYNPRPGNEGGRPSPAPPTKPRGTPLAPPISNGSNNNSRNGTYSNSGNTGNGSNTTFWKGGNGSNSNNRNGSYSNSGNTGNGYEQQYNTEITLYADGDFTGAKKTIAGDWSVSGMGDSWNDAISSIRVPSGWKVIIYRDAGFQGRSMVITGDWSVSGQFDEWNDQISSIRVARQ